MLVHNSDHVKALDVGTYKDLKKSAKVGDAMEHDHIPSSAALQRAKEIELGRDLKPHEIREIHEQGNAIELPKEIHAKGDTYKGRNSQARTDADAADLSAAAERDYATQSQNMIDEGYSPEEVAKAFDELRELNKKRGI